MRTRELHFTDVNPARERGTFPEGGRVLKNCSPVRGELLQHIFTQARVVIFHDEISQIKVKSTA